jgi:hypothetical protein
MTTYTPFLPPPLASSGPFGFSPTLDFQAANGLVPWSLFGRRWYFQLTDTGGNLVVLRALVGSPDGIQNKSITTYSEGFVVVKTVGPHRFKFMDTVDLTLTAVVPTALNGIWRAFVTGPDSYRFQANQVFETVSSYGRTDYNINLVKYYVLDSTLVFRDSTQSFEVTP